MHPNHLTIERPISLTKKIHNLHIPLSYFICYNTKKRKGEILMNKKLQVFVSSTYTDLIEERQAAVQAILDAGHIPAGMELFKAGKSQMKTIQKWIDESDVYMLILGGRYGSIEEESGLSYTELEYKYAISKNMPVFAIVLDENFLFTKAAAQDKDAIFEKDNSNKYDTFKKFVKTKVVKFINNIDQIPSVIHAQLNDIMADNEYNLCGWIKGDTQVEKIDEKQLREEYTKRYSVSYVKKREEIDEKLNPIKNMFTEVSSLNIVTVSGIEFLNRQEKKIRNMLDKGVEIRLVVLKDGTQAFKEHFSNKLHSLKILKESSEKIWENWCYLSNEYKTLLIKYTDICIPYNILYVEKENKEDSFIKVDIYSIDAVPEDRPCLYIKPTDDMFDYFVDQFKIIWQSGFDS